MADQPINRYRVRVIYRSGATIDLETSGFEWKCSMTGALREVAWEADTEPTPMFIGVDDIAAIWNLGPVTA